jgi:hypothetical protein
LYNHEAWSVQAWDDRSTHAGMKSAIIDVLLKYLNLYIGIALFFMRFDFVGVWRSGSAPVLGTGGPRFDPEHPDHLFRHKIDGGAVLVIRYFPM